METLLRRSVALFLFVGLICSNILWVTVRNVPLFPMTNLVSVSLISPPFDSIFLFIGLVLLFLISANLFTDYSKQIIITFNCLSVFWIATDQTRLQPWFYQYNLMLLAFVFDAPMLSCRLALPGIYIWSGVQKFNDNFVSHVYSWLMSPFRSVIPNSLSFLLENGSSISYLIPYLEVAMGIGLVFSITRKLSVVSLIGMHIFILFTLIFHNYNSIVWPWNIAEIVFLLLIFWIDKDSDVGAADMFMKPLLKYSLYYRHVIVLLFFILPALNLFGYWDSYLSFSLYSGRIPIARFRIYDADKTLGEDLLYLKQYIKGVTLEPTLWYINETNAPVYPELRIFFAMGRMLCEHMQDPDALSLELSTETSWLVRQWSKKLVTYPTLECEDLLLSKYPYFNMRHFSGNNSKPKRTSFFRKVRYNESTSLKIINQSNRSLAIYWVRASNDELVKQHAEYLEPQHNLDLMSYFSHKFVLQLAEHINGTESNFTKGFYNETLSVTYNTKTNGINYKNIETLSLLLPEKQQLETEQCLTVNFDTESISLDTPLKQLEPEGIKDI